MFCHKCGSNAIEGADFCQKCGAKLITDKVTVQAPTTIPQPTAVQTSTVPAESASTVTQESVTSKPTTPISEETAEAYDLLKEGMSSCSKIKSVSPAQKGNAIIMKGTIYHYVASIVNGQVKLGRAMTIPCTIPLAIIGGYIAWVIASIGWDFVDNGFNEQYTIPRIEDGTISTHGLKKDPKVFDELVYDVNTSYFDRNYQLAADNWKTLSNLAKEGLKSRGIIKGLKDRITTLLKEIPGLKTKVERYGEGQGITEAMQFYQAKQRAPHRLSEVIADILRKPPEQTEPQKQAETKRKRMVDEVD